MSFSFFIWERAKGVRGVESVCFSDKINLKREFPA